jgi:hypothetical protein
MSAARDDLVPHTEAVHKERSSRILSEGQKAFFSRMPPGGVRVVVSGFCRRQLSSDLVPHTESARQLRRGRIILRRDRLVRNEVDTSVTRWGGMEGWRILTLRPWVSCFFLCVWQLATNIAETSITIDDISYVVDSGRVKENRCMRGA